MAEIGAARQASLAKKNENFGRYSELNPDGVKETEGIQPAALMNPESDSKQEVIPPGLTMADHDEDDRTLDEKDYTASNTEKKSTFKVKRETSNVQILDSGTKTILFKDDSDEESQIKVVNEISGFDGESSMMRGLAGSIAFGPDDQPLGDIRQSDTAAD